MASVDGVNFDARAGHHGIWPRLMLSAALALAYIVTGRLGLLLAVQPGYATAVFLPAGIAIAATFMLGPAVLPAIFAGSFLLNLWVGLAIDHKLDTAAFTIALIIAAASTVQAAAGGAILRRSIGYPAPIDTAADVAKFLALAPALCLISATLSLTGIWAVRGIEPPELLVNWLTWWVGDTLGTLVALPLMLVLGGEPRLLWRSRASFVALPMLVCFALFVAIFARVNAWEMDASLFEFKQQSQRFAEQIKTNLAEQALFLDQLSSVFASERNGLTRDDFHRLVGRLLHQYPTIQAVEWAPRVPSAEREAFEAAQRTAIPDFAIRQRDASGELLPATNAAQFYPVTYVEPLAGNEKALGFDLASDPDRRAAIENTNTSGDVVATAPIRLVQEHGNQFGILLVKSIADGGDGSGVVLVVLRMGAFTRMLAEPLASILNVRFIDSGAKKPFFDSMAAAQPASYGMAFDFGGRHYLVQTSPTALYLAQHRGWQSWAVLAAGVLSTGLLGALLILGTGHAYRVEKLARTHQQLAKIVETSRDAIWSWTNDGTITSWNSEAERMFGYKAEEMIGKSIMTLIPADRINLAYDIISKVSQGQAYVPWETLRINKDGTSIPVELTVSPIHDATGRVLGAATVCRDIAERKRAEAKLRSQLVEIETLYNTAPVGLGLFDRDLRFLRVNSALAEMNGIPADEHIGRRVWDIVPTLRSAGEPLLLRVFETGEIITAETAGETPKQPGVARYWNAVYYPLTGENGEVTAVGVIVEEITERKRAEQRQEVLINELNHRVKNTLSVIQSIAMQTLKNADQRGRPYETFESRLMALAAAHDVLTRGGWESADLYEIVTRAVAPYREPRDRFAIHGPSLPINGKATIAFALALNELCTNSAKYGALSKPTGRVEVEWSAGDELHFVWKELGGPPVRPPKDQGFGTFLITRVLADDIDGKVELDYRPSGLVCTVKASLPLPRASSFPIGHG